MSDNTGSSQIHFHVFPQYWLFRSILLVNFGAISIETAFMPSHIFQYISSRWCIQVGNHNLMFFNFHNFQLHALFRQGKFNSVSAANISQQNLPHFNLLLNLISFLITEPPASTGHIPISLSGLARSRRARWPWMCPQLSTGHHGQAGPTGGGRTHLCALQVEHYTILFHSFIVTFLYYV